MKRVMPVYQKKDEWFNKKTRNPSSTVVEDLGMYYCDATKTGCENVVLIEPTTPLNRQNALMISVGLANIKKSLCLCYLKRTVHSSRHVARPKQSNRHQQQQPFPSCIALKVLLRYLTYLRYFLLYSENFRG